jgi:lysophospholipase L1-like esterase
MQRILFITLLFLTSICTCAQDPPFWNDIQAFKKQDSISMPQPGQIVFVGSSSFTKWQDVQQYFPNYSIINRGFGGSTLPDVIRYANDIIFPYKPKQVVIYCGENDFASSDSVTVEMVVNRFSRLYFMIRSRFRDASIAFVSIKPSPSRQHLWTKFKEANRIIENFLKKQKNTAFVNVYDKMLKPDGQAMEDVFLEDRLHMNKKGYVIWQKEIEPYLVK